MDFEEHNNFSEPKPPEDVPSCAPEPAPTFAQAPPAQAGAPQKRTGWRIFWRFVLVLSILANIMLFLMLTGVAAIFAVGQEGLFTEDVIREGPPATKLAVVSLEGIIDGIQARDIYLQLRRARKDDRVKGIILRVNSPGGTISGSDQIYNEIRARTDKPVVAFMQGVAASGGYYASVACDRIVAEPTAITGSVGVIAGYMVLQELLEEKLGIQPITIKQGKRKDWPSSFRAPSEEEIQYLQEKLIIPAYNRFVQVIAEGRKGILTPAEVELLADGSIYGAQEALEQSLIDKIGYLDEAIEEAKMLAGIDEAQVVEYRKPFSLASFLRSQSEGNIRIDKKTLYELSVPQVLYLWTASQ
ncbi:MAG: signal peptide peptidase SppA [Planctomycetota bacterium]|jgi:protease-4